MLSGSHRSGKTTLAKAFSKHAGIEFVETGASHVFAEMGFNPKIDYPLRTRLEIQKRILDDFYKQCRKYCAKHFITDRTPIDFIAYTMADVQRQNVDEALARDIDQYLADCVQVANELFPLLVVLQPGIALVEAEGKAPANIAYMEHINLLCMGAVVSEGITADHWYIPRHVLTVEERVEYLSGCVIGSGNKFKRYQEAQKAAGVPMVFH